MRQFACKNLEIMASKLSNRELLEGFWYFAIRQSSGLDLKRASLILIFPK